MIVARRTHIRIMRILHASDISTYTYLVRQLGNKPDFNADKLPVKGFACTTDKKDPKTF
jgi:hypothetical protein